MQTKQTKSKRLSEVELFAGIDVQINRGCAYYVLDRDKKWVAGGWIKENIAIGFGKLFHQLSSGNNNRIAIGIDAPRMPIKKLRNRYFDKKEQYWEVREKLSIGRECEVVINAYRIGNCQWTNTLEKSPEWMQLGFSIFEALAGFPFVYEVFPSASYRMLDGKNISYEINLNGFKHGVKDMLDASVSAITVMEFIRGNGCEVGGGDGLGTIVLPRKIGQYPK